VTGDLPPGTTTAHIDSHYAEALDSPCHLCTLVEAEPGTVLCRYCIADAAAKLSPDYQPPTVMEMYWYSRDWWRLRRAAQRTQSEGHTRD
jgi:hypothetical protein